MHSEVVEPVQEEAHSVIVGHLSHHECQQLFLCRLDSFMLPKSGQDCQQFVSKVLKILLGLWRVVRSYLLAELKL